MAQELIEELKRRCGSEGLAVEEKSERHEVDGRVYNNIGWRVFSPTERFKGSVWLANKLEIEFALSTEFYKFEPIDGYEGLWSPMRLEAELVLDRPWVLSDHPLSAILNKLDPSQIRMIQDKPRESVIAFPPVGRALVTLRYASAELLVWRTLSPAVHLLEQDALVPCVRIDGLPIIDSGQARETMIRVANAALLELEQRTGIAARLRSHYPWRLRLDFGKRSPLVLQSPKLSPDKIPFDLYMNARLETTNPAARFLGLYQVLEYYFPHFWLAAIKKEHKSERNMLRLTIEGIVAVEALRLFIESDSDLATFYAIKNPPIVVDRVDVTSESLCSDVAERLYNIRCRIVHTKQFSPRSESVFVPFAAEAAELEPDIWVMKFLALRAINATAHPYRECDVEQLE